MNDASDNKPDIWDITSYLCSHNKKYPALIKEYLDFARSTGQDPALTPTLSLWIDSLTGDSSMTKGRKFKAVTYAMYDYFERLNYNPMMISQLNKEFMDIKKLKNIQEVDNHIDRSRILSNDDYQTLMINASHKMKLIMEFLWDTGCLVSEMTAIKQTDISVIKDKQIVSIRIHGKANKERTIYVYSGLIRSIESAFGVGDYLFQTKNGGPISRIYISNTIINLSKETLDGKYVSAHDFRHTFADRKIRETKKINAISKYLGHSSVSVTMNMYQDPSDVESMTEEELLA